MSESTRRLCRFCLCVTVIAAGLTLRGFGLGLGLPAMVVKYGGSLLWGTMMWFLVSIALPTLSCWRVALLAALIAISVETFRLFHTPWLDTFRLTTSGALLLGRVFSFWNLLAYGCGIALGALLDGGVKHTLLQRYKICDRPIS